jgi:PIN domain nuclease of toxin-antitoxin system
LRVLLDTHVWLWMWAEPENLRNEARTILEDPSTELHVSAANAWEIATKAQAGRLALTPSAEAWLTDPRHLEGVTTLPVTFMNAIRAATLPPHHRDPFDRMLIAQAQTEGLVLMSADRQLAAYDVESFSA